MIDGFDSIVVAVRYMLGGLCEDVPLGTLNFYAIVRLVSDCLDKEGTRVCVLEAKDLPTLMLGMVHSPAADHWLPPRPVPPPPCTSKNS